MKGFLKSLRRQDGFTLVELMVVVAIIGLLSAVAIPNFKKYQAKAKISEAKLQLASLYTAQSAFFSDYNMYGTCLRYMGFDPAREKGNRYYGIGLANGSAGNRNANAHTAAVNSGMQETDCPVANAVVDDPGVAAATANTASWYPAGKGIGGVIIGAASSVVTNPAGISIGCTESTIGTATGNGSCVGLQSDATTMVFQMAAIGYISGDFVTIDKASGLTINHNKIIKSVQNGY